MIKKILLGIYLILTIPSFAFLGGGGGGSDYWQMKTYFETVVVNANTLKQYQTQLEKLNHAIEQAKKMPDEFFQKHLKEYAETLQTINKIQNNTKSVLRDAKKAELWMKDIYSDVKNKNYMNLLDRFVNELDNLSYDSMKTAGLAAQATKKNVENMNTLVKQAKNTKNPVQLLDVLSGMTANLSSQLSTITEVLTSDSRLKALEEAEKAYQRKLELQRYEYTKNSLEKSIEKMEKKRNQK